MLLESEEAMGITPPGLRKKIELEPHLLFYMEVFQELSDSRDYTQNGYPLAIKETEFRAFFDTYEFSPAEARYTREAVKLIDRCWRTELSKKLDKKNATPPKP